MQKLDHGKIYLGETFNRTYIGKYNDETKQLEDVLGIIIDEKNQINLIPAANPALLLKKITLKLTQINIDIDKFLYLNDPDGLEYGDGIKQVYIETTTGVTLSSSLEDEKDLKEKSGIILES